MRLLSLEIPEPNATKSQIDRSDATRFGAPVWPARSAHTSSRTGQLERSADFREQGTKVRSCRVVGASAIHVRRMNELTKDALREIEQIHSNWIKYEVAGDNHSLMALCADDIELWPPDAQPLLGRAAVSAQMARGMTKIHSIEITDLRIRGSNEIAYLTASYRTTFSSAEDSTCRQAFGSHLWMLRKRTGTWVVTLVSWSVWGRADTSATSRK
jgi:ketosteroid isomerase-like protein